jgi:acyl-CoA reductase-like NAD-dependent aldehyde dehydrogenase
VKQSGFGREGSQQGINDYLKLKFMYLGDIQHPKK